jgi:hypothetical protein
MTNHSFKKCFSTLGCPDLDLDAVLSLAQDHEIDGLESKHFKIHLVDKKSQFLS